MTTDKAYLIADGSSDAPPAATARGKAEAAGQDSVDDGPAFDGECWAFSSRYVKTTQAALQTALDVIQVAIALVPADHYISWIAGPLHTCVVTSSCMAQPLPFILGAPRGSTLLLFSTPSTEQTTAFERHTTAPSMLQALSRVVENHA